MFGSQFMPQMASTSYANGHWSTPQIVPSDALTLHPGSHVFHYASTCFEGLKAFRHEDDSVNIFRMDQNICRFAQSSRLLYLPPIDEKMVEQMIIDIVSLYKDQVPEMPGSMYIRPTHIGTDPCIGKAAHPSDESMVFVLLSPVGDYFSSQGKGLTLLLDDVGMRCAPHNGRVKSGGNYASALQHLIQAKEKHDADQVLFCPDGYVSETGAANFIFIDDKELITKPLDDSFLHGITRDSILQLAKQTGYTVSERELSIDELLSRATNPKAEAAVSGTAAVLAPIDRFIYQDKTVKLGGASGDSINQLKQALNYIQWGKTEDNFNWLRKV